MVISDVVPYLLTDDPTEAFKAGIFKNNNGNFKSDHFFHFGFSERPPKNILELKWLQLDPDPQLLSS